MFSGSPARKIVRFLSHSSLLRYTLIHTAIVLVLCSASLWLVKDYSLDDFQRRQDDYVQVQLHSLASFASTSSEEDFLQAVRKLADESRQLLVVVKHLGGYAGNLNYLPETVPLAPKADSFWILGDAVLGNGRLQTVRGSRVDTRWGPIVVAYNSSDFNLFVSRFNVSLGIAIMLVLVAGLLTGFLFSRKVLERLGRISRVTSRVSEGCFSARVDVGKRRDEFGELATHVNRMLDRIEHSMEAVSSVTSSIAHDLRTPLSRLRIRLDGFLTKGGADSGDILKAQTELDTILHTFNAMLELTKLEYGESEWRFESCSLAGVCRDVFELAEPLAEEKKQILVLEAEHDFNVLGNQQLLFRAFFNLVENAVKYSPEESTIRIVLSDFSVKVVDQGDGIPVEEQEKVFRRLYRGDASRSSPGHGLGLPLVRAVAGLHQATVGFEQQADGFAAVVLFSE